MARPYVTIDLDRIEHNARTIVGLCARHGIEVTGVTKGVSGDANVAAAMRRGGVSSIGDSHLENVRHLQGAGIRGPFVLLRLPPPAEAAEVIDLADVSLESESGVLEALSRAAQKRGRRHDVVLMVDLGDLREGVWPNDLLPLARWALALPGIRIKGIGTNLACFGAVAPSEENMSRLVALAEEIERRLGLRLDWISGANSSGLELIAAGRMPKRVNHARIGEAILLGRETVRRRPWPGTFQDVFLLHAQVLELRSKPSLPIGERCEDAFGRHPVFEDRGNISRALLNVGREDVDIDALAPVDRRIAILGGSSDYLVVDASAARELRVGDEITFSLAYGALLATMTSPYVEKRPLRGGAAVAHGA